MQCELISFFRTTLPRDLIMLSCRFGHQRLVEGLPATRPQGLILLISYASFVLCSAPFLLLQNFGRFLTGSCAAGFVQSRLAWAFKIAMVPSLTLHRYVQAELLGC